MNPPISTAPGPTYCWKLLQFCWIRNSWSVLWAKTRCNIEMDRSLWSRHFSLLCHRKLRRQRLEIAWRSEAILGRLRRSPCTGQSRVWNSFFDKQTHTYTREKKMSVEFWYWKCSAINNKTRSKMQARINNTLFVNVTQLKKKKLLQKKEKCFVGCFFLFYVISKCGLRHYIISCIFFIRTKLITISCFKWLNINSSH